MSVEQFLRSPWKNSHPKYDQTPLSMRPAPEFATAEAIVASLYRALGFKDASEGSIPAAGRQFDKATQHSGHSERVGSGLSGDTWRTVLHGVLTSPKQPNQSSKRFLQLCPVVPDVALYSGSARLSANSWNPGQLIQRMVLLGSYSLEDARSLWRRLFDGMSVASKDDLWARWLHAEFDLRRSDGVSWDYRDIPIGSDLVQADKLGAKFPAQQFVKDLDAVIEAKASMTRRQWISLLESVLRLASVTHVLWLCKVHEQLWREIRRVIDGGEPLAADEIRRKILSPRVSVLTYANPAVPKIRDQAAHYLSARLGINLMLWKTTTGELGDAFDVASADGIAQFLGVVKTMRKEMQDGLVMQQYAKLTDQEARVVACKRGIGSNIVEFCRHVLGQRQAATETLRGYDQGYVLRKKASYSSAPWVVSLGPVSILALVHCCLRQAVGPRSIQRLCVHLDAYGLEVDRDDIATGELGGHLRMLGLVLDSPDAETGMLLVPPFRRTLGT